MELINTTAVPGRCTVHEIGPGHRAAVLLAKATFRIGGRIELTADEALPLFEDDRPGEGGVIPGDVLARHDDGFEVFSIGSAHAPGDAPTRAMTVSLSVGDITRTMLVVGDRKVEPHPSALPRPEPFVTMPLGWERAFGGTQTVYVDHDAEIDVAHPLNGKGRGFDARPTAKALARRLRAPNGFPVLTGDRRLPNVEHPDRPMRQLDDDPEPYGWSAIPRSIGLSMRARQHHAALRPGCDAAAYRAHPDWVLTTPPAGARVRAVGLTSDGDTAFALPRLRCFADARGATLELRPQAMTLLWHRGLMTVTYRRAVSLAVMRPRRVRLRLAEGWWTERESEVSS